MNRNETELLLIRMINELATCKQPGLTDINLSERLFPGRIDQAELLHALAEHDGRFKVYKGFIRLSETGVNFFQTHLKPKVIVSPRPQLSQSELFKMDRARAAVAKYVKGLERLRFEIKSCQKIGKVREGRFLYSMVIRDLAEEFHPSDETPVIYFPKVNWKKPRQGSIAGFDDQTDRIFITLDTELDFDELEGSVEVNKQLVWGHLASTLQQWNELPKNLIGLIEEVPVNGEIKVDGSDSFNSVLKNLSQPWQRLVWGPPGSGKTYLLAQYIASRLEQETGNFRILVSAPSNYAVDALMVELLRIEKLKPLLDARKILRFGYPKDERILREGRLFGTEQLAGLKGSIRDLLDRRNAHRKQDSETKAAYAAELHMLLEQLREELKQAVATSRVVATTITSSLMPSSPVFSPIPWDLTIVDEVSMVSTVATIPLLQLGSREVLLCGDPRQLAPVCEVPSTKRDADIQHWIAKNPFDSLGLSLGDKERKAVKEDGRIIKISTQRRCAPQIWRLVSDLYPHVEERVDQSQFGKVQALAPRPGEAVCFLDTCSGNPLPKELDEKDIAHLEPLVSGPDWISVVKEASSWCQAQSITRVDITFGLKSIRFKTCRYLMPPNGWSLSCSRSQEPQVRWGNQPLRATAVAESRRDLGIIC